MEVAAAFAVLLCAAGKSHASLEQVTQHSSRSAELLSVRRRGGGLNCMDSTAQVGRGSTARQRQAAAMVSDKVENRTFLVAADIAEQCQDACELRLRHLGRGSSASAVIAATPLLSVNTLRLQLPLGPGCSLALEVACAAGTSCQASGEVVVDDVVVLQQDAASADYDDDSMSGAVTMLTQSILVQHMAGEAVSTPPALNAHQSMRFASMSTRQLLLSTVCVLAMIGLQGCLLDRMRDQGRSHAKR